MELINEDSASRILSANTFQGNKLFIHNRKDFLSLKKGTYIIHVYTRSEFSATRNVLVYASERVDIHLRKEKYFNDLKIKAIQNVYKQVENTIQS